MMTTKQVTTYGRAQTKRKNRREPAGRRMDQNLRARETHGFVHYIMGVFNNFQPASLFSSYSLENFIAGRQVEEKQRTRRSGIR